MFKWILILVLLGMIFLGLLDYFAISFVELNGFLYDFRAVILSLGTLLVILLATIFTTNLSNTSADRRQEADRFLNAELKLSEFRQAWINLLRDDFAEFIAIAYDYFHKDDAKAKKLQSLKRLDARIRMRLNPKKEADLEREIESLVVKLVNELEYNKEDEAIKTREKLAQQGAIFLKKEWDELKKKLDLLKSGNP